MDDADEINQINNSLLTHAIWGRICVDGLFWLPLPNLPLSILVPHLDQLLEFRPFHAFVQKELS